MTKKKKILIFGVAAVLLAIAAVVIILLAGKQETYRFIEIDQYNGSVTLERNGTKPELFEGLHLVTNDMVSTGAASDILLLADTDKHILAEENTGFSIEAEGDETKGRIAVNLLYGSSLITIDNKLPDGSEFVVNTPNAALSVRGTIFHVAYDPETETTTVEVTEGVVEVVSADGTQNIEAGGSCVVSGNARNENNTAANSVMSDTTTTTEALIEEPKYDPKEIADMIALYLRDEGELNTDMLKNVIIFGIDVSAIYTHEDDINMKEFSIFVNSVKSEHKLYEHEHIIDDYSFLNYCNELEYLSLHQLELSDSQFATIQFEKLPKLKNLYLFKNQISDISSLKNLANLESLNLGLNNVSDISPLENLTLLIELELGNNEISDISQLQNLKNLEVLSLTGNDISDFSPIKDLTNLKNLSLYGTKISDLSPLANLKKLNTLRLGLNEISDISPLIELKSLKKLDLGLNFDLSESQIETLRKSLPDCEIDS